MTLTTRIQFCSSLIVTLGIFAANLALIEGCSSTPPTAETTSAATSRERQPAGLPKFDIPPDLANVPVTVRGSDAKSYSPTPSEQPPVLDTHTYDVIVVGGGLAGLSSAVYLTDAGKRVLLLERESELGGLAAWSEGKDHIPYDRGAAYWTDAYEEEIEILKHIGLGDFKKRNPIPDPIDSYYVRGEFYNDIWETRTLQKLPASFALFRQELIRTNLEKKIPNQPFEEFTKYDGTMELDAMSARQWIENMPKSMEEYLRNPKIGADDKNGRKRLKDMRQILTRFKKELASGRLTGATGMEPVIELLDLYCRSALGNKTDFVSAMAFANFYISEIETRYTSPHGTGAAALHMARMLETRPQLFSSRTEATVTHVSPDEKGADVTYSRAGQNYRAHARFVVFAAQLVLAPRMIEGFEEKAPEQARLMKSIGYSHYSVHALQMKGHPYRASYDTWTRGSDYTDDDFTDVILGNWMDPRMRGYKGLRDFKKDPPIKDGILTVYQPLPQKWIGRDYSDEEAKQLALYSADRVRQLYTKLPENLWKGDFAVQSIESSRWPLSVHIASPGYYTNIASKLRRPFGPVFFANNNLGTPAFEEALFRGHCAAVNILLRLNRAYKPEKWTRCPIEG